MDNISKYISEKLNSIGFLVKGDPNVLYITIGEYKAHASYMRRRYSKLCLMLDPMIKGEDDNAWISFSYSVANGWTVYEVLNDITHMKSNEIDKINYNDLEIYFN